MAALNELIRKIENPELRSQIQEEFDKLARQKKFGLVFEEHLPECTPLFDVPVCTGSKVSRKNGRVSDLFTVVDIENGKAICLPHGQKEVVEFDLSEVVATAEFGEPIYPYLKKLETVCNAPESDLWHTLIQAENYHALQLLEYLYAGKVDCIYIDPPYNTGARDWKYNNDYVDSSDSYRHSKWLSMMQRRLRIAKRLLNPRDSVLIVTIDEKEYHHLGCLLEEMFPEARIQMVSSVINVKGVAKGTQFSRTNEYLFFIQFGISTVNKISLSAEWLGNVRSTGKDKVRLAGLMRSGSGSHREDSPGCFYPIYFDKNDKFIRVGEVCPVGVDRHSVSHSEEEYPIWPLHRDRSEGRWMYRPDGLRELIKKGYVFWSKRNGETMGVSYAPKGVQKKIDDGLFKIIGFRDDGSIIIDDNEYSATYVPGSQWAISSHNATEYGTKNLQNIIGNRFSYPKSLYAVHDAIRFFVANKPNALILDFFAGSGTTLHAVNLLNAEDGGKRRCILVTNNEVSDDEAKSLRARGHHPGDREWEKLGIAQYVAWPRTVCSIEGHDVNGNPLKGNYLGSDRPMADGFESNAIFFKLGFLDKTFVALGRQFRELLPVLWMKAGAIGKCPTLDRDEVPDMLILPENRMAILNDESRFGDFEKRLKEQPQIDRVFLVTDYEPSFVSMRSSLNMKHAYQLYRDYLDNFRINAGRNAR